MLPRSSVEELPAVAAPAPHSAVPFEAPAREPEPVVDLEPPQAWNDVAVIREPEPVDADPAYVMSGAVVAPSATGTGERLHRVHREALAAARAGRVLEAQARFESLLQQQPGHVATRRNLAILLAGAGDLAAARSLLSGGLALTPRQPELLALAARLALEAGDSRDAVALLQALADEDRTAEHEALLAAAWQRAGNHVAAARSYRRALEADPERSAWWLGLAISSEADGRLLEARRAYRNALTHGGLDAQLRSFAVTRLRSGGRG